MDRAGGYFRDLFINDEGELRSGWRAFAFYAVLVVVSFVLGNIAVIVIALATGVETLPLQPQPTAPASDLTILVTATISIIQLASALIASAICARALERRSLASVGFKLHRGWLSDFLYGSLGGGAALALAVALAAAAGTIGIDAQHSSPLTLAVNFLVLLIIFLIAAAFEELLLRGFPFQALAHNIGPLAALAITSILFGLLHYQNPNSTLLSTFNTILAGVWLGAAYLKTRSLWLATTLHYSWNLVMVFIFGLPVSGITMYSHLAWLRSQPEEPAWFSGGSYGPEGGLAATVALVISTLVIWKVGLFSASEEMMAAIRHGPKQGPQDQKITS
jgi:membrane protease YdiL (CAAX protease family)